MPASDKQMVQHYASAASAAAGVTRVMGDRPESHCVVV